MNNIIPYQLFGTQSLEKCIFLHGNGFPPNSYQSFLNNLGENLAVYAMHQRPFWETDLNPNKIKGWDIFKKDTIQFLKQNNLVSTGDLIINTASIPIDEKGKTNMLKLSLID